MLFVSLRDLQWRLRRFVIGVLATGLVFAIALLISGINSSFQNEASRAVKAFHADQWLIPTKAFGPFTSSSPILDPISVVNAVKTQPGVREANPVLIFPLTVGKPTVHDINVVGVVPGGVGSPVVTEGHTVAGSGEAVADKSLGVKIGATLRLGNGESFRVVGRTSGVSYNVGTPVVFIPLANAQVLFAGQAVPWATAVIVKGTVAKAPPGMQVLGNPRVLNDLRRPLKRATSTIGFLRVLLWIIAAGIIGSVLYLQAIERTRDFAVFKATGVSSRTLLIGITLQAIMLAASAAVTALLIAWLLAPTMTLRIEVPPSAYFALPIVAVAVGLIASLFGLRRAVTVDPAVAFGG